MPDQPVVVDENTARLLHPASQPHRPPAVLSVPERRVVDACDALGHALSHLLVSPSLDDHQIRHAAADTLERSFALRRMLIARSEARHAAPAAAGDSIPWWMRRVDG